MKRILSLGLAAALAAGALTGCGGNQQASSAADTTAAS